MEKTEARRRLDTYIDACLDCDGEVTEETEETPCHTCKIAPEIIKTVQEIRKARKNKI